MFGGEGGRLGAMYVFLGFCYFRLLGFRSVGWVLVGFLGVFRIFWFGLFCFEYRYFIRVLFFVSSYFLG